MSNFNNVMAVLRKHANHKEEYLIAQIFPQATMTLGEHFVRKLQALIERFGFYAGMGEFYRQLDLHNQKTFDVWVEKEIFELTA